MKALLLLSLIAGSSAFAIDTKNCPKRLTVTVGGLKVTRAPEQVLKDLANGYGSGMPLEPIQVEGVKYSLKAIRMAGQLNEYYDLQKAANGKCVYERSMTDIFTEKAEIYTSKGKNLLYIQTSIGPRGIMLRTYFSVLSVRPDQVLLAETPAVLALAVPRDPYTSYDRGGPMANVGQAMNFNVEAHAK